MSFKEKFEKFKVDHSTTYKKENKRRSVVDGLEFDIEFTETEIKHHKDELKELELDLAVYKRLKDLIKDKEFKSKREFAKYILSLDGDIMKDYERVYGDTFEY